MKPRIVQALHSLLVASLVIGLIWIRERYDQTHPSKSKSRASTASWETLQSCHLVPHPANDGDSFVVAHGNSTHTFRLYFVDCPEKELRRDNRSRLEDQAHYFRLPSAEAASSVGQASAAFVLPYLKRPFTVITHWERAFDSQRFYARVIVENDHHQQRDLAELLVENGYARIFTKGAHLPGTQSESQFKKHLRTLESASRAAQRGAWYP